MTRENKKKVFELLASTFETNLMKDYYMDMIAELPDYTFTMPASTSGKFHNVTQCQKHGQLYHVYMFHAVLNHRLRLKGNRNLYPTPEERDCMRCVPALHDAFKSGLTYSGHTVQDHPLLAAKWILETKVEHDIPQEYKKMIADMCEAHSGEWNKDSSGNAIMYEPRNMRELFIHECDILSSRADLDYIIPEELKVAISENLIE